VKLVMDAGSASDAVTAVARQLPNHSGGAVDTMV